MANVLQWNQSTNSFSVSGSTAITPVVGEGIDNNFSVPQTFGSAINQTASAGANNQSALLNTGDVFSDLIVSGIQWDVPSPASLTASMSAGVAWLLSQRTLVPAVDNYTFPTSSDTYASFNNAGEVAYQSVANGATAPAPESGYVQTAKVVTSPIQSPTPTLVAGTSGSLASGTYGVALVAYDATGYGAVGASGSVTVAASGSIDISWVNPLNETSMDIYATDEGGSTLGLVASGVTGTSYTYTGATAPGAAAPTTATSNAVQLVESRLPIFNIPYYYAQPLSQTLNLRDYSYIKGLGPSGGWSANPGVYDMIIASSSGYATLKDFVLDANSPGQGTALQVPGAGNIEGLVINNPYNGIVLGDSSFVRGCTINSATNNCIEITGDNVSITQHTNAGGANIDGSGTGIGLLLSNANEGIVVSDTELYGNEYALKATPIVETVSGYGNVAAFNRFSNVFFDSSSMGADIDWMMDTVFTACWFSNRPGNGATVGTNFSQGIQFIGCTFENSDSNGLAIMANAVNTTVIGCLIKGNNGSNNGSYGIYVANDTKGFTISKNVITNLIGGNGYQQVAAIYIGTGCDDYTIEDNYLLGNAATIIDNSQFTARNRIVKNNIGYSEPALPNFLPNSSFLFGTQTWYLQSYGGTWSVGTDYLFPYLQYSAPNGTDTFYPYSAPITDEYALTVGNFLCLSFFARNTTGGSFAAFLVAFDGSTNVQASAPISITGSEWSFYSVNMNITASNVSSIVMYMKIVQDSTGTNLSIGQIKVNAGSSPREWSDEASSQLFTAGVFQPDFSNILTTNSTTTNGTTSGTVDMYMPLQGNGKQVTLTFNAYENNTTTAQTIDFPTAFSVTPLVIGNNTGLTLTVSTTGVTITAPDNTTTYSGTAVIMGN